MKDSIGAGGVMNDDIIQEERLLAVARDAARRAGDYAASNVARRHDVNSATRADVKHKLDVECEAVVRKVVMEAFPGHAFLGEESSGASADSPGYVWIVDPIDGTVNFFHGSPHWNCSVAVWREGRPVAGVVYAPMERELYEATASGPALLNGSAVRVSDTSDLSMALVGTGVGKPAPGSGGFSRVDRLAAACQRVRVAGSAALDICSVARGSLDAYFESGIYVWDMAAASLVLERAGGRSEVLARRDDDGAIAFLATNGLLHSAMRAVAEP